MTLPSGRRGFLKAAAATAAAFASPRRARGLTATELSARVVDDKVAPGVSKWELDTPALCVDLDRLEGNLAALRTGLAGTGVASRPHAKTHKCAAIAKRQLAAGSIGICTAKVSEAEALFAEGVTKILMTTANVTPAKIRRAMAIAKKSRSFVQAVDHPDNARALSEAAKAAGLTADVVVDVAVGTRTGVPAGDQALALAQLVDTLPNLRLRGMLAYDGGAQHIKGYQTRAEQALQRMEPALRTFERMKAAGLDTGIFSGGGTGTYDIMTKIPGFTDVQAGSYVFMDTQYLEIGGARDEAVFTDFAPSLTVLTTILNAYFPGRLTTDAGTKALTLNKPDPIVIGEPGFAYTAGSDEFGVIRYENATKAYKVGDKLELIVPHCDPVVNEYDVLYATRKDRVEAVWPITARGKSQ